jgi:hypothetical protein
MLYFIRVVFVTITFLLTCLSLNKTKSIISQLLLALVYSLHITEVLASQMIAVLCPHTQHANRDPVC